MKAIWTTRRGRPEVLEVREGSIPEPGPGEVRIAVRAAGLNFAEVAARQGLYPDAPPLPAVLGYELAGTIDALGEGVETHARGARVAALMRFGAHASHVCVPAAQAFPIPEAMPFEEGAALPVNYVTAYHMLFRIRRLQPGETVLVHMAAGGVGTAALQLCRSVPDVRVIGTCSKGKHEYAREQGCDHPIDYRSVDYVEEVRRITEGRGVDLVLDALGGADWAKGYSLLRSTGTLIAFGWANMIKPGRRRILHVLGQLARLRRYSPMTLMGDNRAIAGVNLGHLWHEAEMIQEECEALIRLYEAGVIRPRIDRSFSFEEAAQAHHHLEGAKNLGKIVLIPEPE